MSGDDAATRWAWVDVDLDAIRHNVEHLRAVVAPASLWAVVKAGGYGHGAVDVAHAALEAGAQGLCVALVGEGAELRRAGIDAPILVLSEQPLDAADDIVRYRLMATVYTVPFVDALASAAHDRGVDGLPVHLKIDTGMQRVGVRGDDLGQVVAALEAHDPTLRLVGVFTHLATADQPDNQFTAVQLARFDHALEALPVANGVLVHVANSAGALAHPAARRSFVRAGIAIYGISPGHAVDSLCGELRPALSLKARVSHVKRAAAGTGISYGLRHTFSSNTTVATVPIGYADGVPRRLFEVGGHVLIGGRRRRIVGVVTMDQLMVDCGDPTGDPAGDPTGDAAVAVGDEVVLIGAQEGPDGSLRIRAEDWADLLGTIGYEIVCGIGSRVPRRLGRNIEPAMLGRDNA